MAMGHRGGNSGIMRALVELGPAIALATMATKAKEGGVPFLKGFGRSMKRRRSGRSRRRRSRSQLF
tara:strand:- start:352 stop:549 length:198 start_codon:yes stop_codon:yes gene_type:complete